MQLNKILLVSAIAITGGCAVPKKQLAPAISSVPETFLHTADTDTSQVSQPVRTTVFTDTVLLSLIDTALQHNADMVIAVQKLNLSATELYRRKAAFLPSLEATASAGITRYGDYTIDGVGNFDTNLSGNINDKQRTPDPLVPDYFVGFRSSWELDIWGKLKALKTAASYQYLSDQAAQQMVKTELVAQVASLYYELLAKDNERAILEKNIQLQETALEIIRTQKTGGRATELAVQQFQAQLLRTQGAVFLTNQEITALENQLCFVLGKYPERIKRGTPLNLQQMPVTLNTGIPAQLLKNRPDIRREELKMKAATAGTEAARLSFRPSFLITPYAGLNSFKAGLLFSPESAALGLLGNISAPLLNQRALKANHREAATQAAISFQEYRKTVLNAVQEVSSGLNAIQNISKAYQYKEQEFNVLNNGVSTANDLFLGGYANYLEVITAQRTVLETELELSRQKKELLLSQVKLYRALGGN